MHRQRPSLRHRLLDGLFLALLALASGCIGLPGLQTQPLTTQRLRQIALAQGIGLGKKGIQLNWAIGRAFQDHALLSMALPENHMPFQSLLRQQRTQQRSRIRFTVVPDAVAGTQEAVVSSDGQARVIPHPVCAFIEVKAVRGTLYRSSSEYQHDGLVDAIGVPRCVTEHTNPALIYVTTANTIVGTDVLAFATSRQVAVWQIMVHEVQHSGPGPTLLTLAQAQLLNPLPGRLLPSPNQSFTTPRPLRTGLAPSDNPDPTELVP